jgi:hypothetical protein
VRAAEPLFFYVSPRTGSTSLVEYLKAVFGRKRVMVRKVAAEIYQGNPITASSKSPDIATLTRELGHPPPVDAYVVMGPFGLHTYLPHPVRLCTVLRDPFDRCVSLLRFMHARPDLNEVNRKVASYGLDLDAVLGDNEILCFHNEQVRILSGSPARRLCSNDHQEAVRNLHKFHFVGCFGDFDSISNAVSLSHPAALSVSFPCLNGVATEITLDAFQSQALKEANALDDELWRSFGGPK